MEHHEGPAGGRRPPVIFPAAAVQKNRERHFPIADAIFAIEMPKILNHKIVRHYFGARPRQDIDGV